VAIGFLLLASSRNWHTATSLFKLQQETYCPYQQNSGKPIFAISWLVCRYQLYAAGAPLIWISHIFWLKPLKPVLCDLRGKFPFNVKINYWRFNAKGRPFD
jgi:hypothetical protein